MSTSMESPACVKTSLAGAICLGMEPGRFLRDAKCTCLNLLLTYKEGCYAACSYCGLACSRDNEARPTFIRVKWPAYALEDVLERVQTGQHPFRRVCVSMVSHPRAQEDACTIIRQIKMKTGLPVSGLLTPTVMKGLEDMKGIKEAGADRVGIAIDAATPELFALNRGRGVKGPHRWERYWEAVSEAVEVFGAYHAGVHLIVGLGETEKQMVEVISRAYRLGAVTHLFSFFPEAGSLLEKHAQPELGQYRRIQLARYLINEGIISGEAISYNAAGEIVEYGLEVEAYLSTGLPFMTSGCPGEDGVVACNRPFGNERASQPMRNYPFIPEQDDLTLIHSQLWPAAGKAHSCCE